MTRLAERFRKWFDYEEDAHEKVVASLETIPENRRDDGRYLKCLKLLGHIASARGLWLYEWRSPAPRATKSSFPRA